MTVKGKAHFLKLIIQFVLLQFFTGNFDGSVGPKTEKDSYTAIAGEIGVSASEVLYITDLPRGEECCVLLSV